MVKAKLSLVFHSHSGFSIRLFVALRLTLVYQFLSSGNAQFHFYFSAFQIHAKRDEGQPLFLRFSDKLADFFLVQQQLSGPCRIVVIPVAVGVRADVAVE